MEPFLGEIRYFAFGFAPSGWAECNGAQLVPQQNAALFALLGVQYGGNGTTTFNLPDLRGRAPMSLGVRQTDNTYYVEGQALGAETVALTGSQVPAHTHQLYASSNTPANNADNKNPAANLTGHAATGGFPPPNTGGVGLSGLYNNAATATTAVTMHTNTVLAAGNNARHENCAPSLVLMPCIAVQGLFPPRQ